MQLIKLTAIFCLSLVFIKSAEKNENKDLLTDDISDTRMTTYSPEDEIKLLEKFKDTVSVERIIISGNENILLLKHGMQKETYDYWLYDIIIEKKNEKGAFEVLKSFGTRDLSADWVFLSSDSKKDELNISFNITICKRYGYDDYFAKRGITDRKSSDLSNEKISARHDEHTIKKIEFYKNSTKNCKIDCKIKNVYQINYIINPKLNTADSINEWFVFDEKSLILPLLKNAKTIYLETGLKNSEYEKDFDGFSFAYEGKINKNGKILFFAESLQLFMCTKGIGVFFAVLVVDGVKYYISKSFINDINQYLLTLS
jgi:hypothetical protein